MSKKNTIEKVRHPSNKNLTWDAAIQDAEKMILEAKEKISKLKRAIRAFRAMQDSGEPFPGESSQALEVEP